MRNRACGLTLIELLITIVVLAILLTLVIPNIRDTFENNRIARVGNEIITAINIARNEAVSRGTTVEVCPTGKTDFKCESGGWNEGWLVWQDIDGNGALDKDKNEIIRSSTESLRGDTNIDAPGDLADGIAFDAQGTSTKAAGSDPMKITSDSSPCRLEINIGASGSRNSEWKTEGGGVKCPYEPNP